MRDLGGSAQVCCGLGSLYPEVVNGHFHDLTTPDKKGMAACPPHPSNSESRNW